MANRVALLKSIASTIADYRQGEITTPTPDHVERWIQQFEQSVQNDLLVEIDHVLKFAYLTRSEMVQWLTRLSTTAKVAGNDPATFWRTANFLRLQRQGSSQADMLAIFNTVLKNNFGFGIQECGSPSGPYIYVDDCILSGNRVLGDLAPWLKSSSVQNTTLHIIAPMYHSGGEYYAKTRLEKVIADNKCNVTTQWWRSADFEDRKAYIDGSEVLRPSVISGDLLIDAYVQELTAAGWPPVWRTAGAMPKRPVFSSSSGRDLLERELLRAGLRIRSFSARPNRMMKPLGYTKLDTFGFGAIFVSYRNCPNNCPLALWWGDPYAGSPLNRWYPLFPRKV